MNLRYPKQNKTTKTHITKLTKQNTTPHNSPKNPSHSKKALKFILKKISKEVKNQVTNQIKKQNFNFLINKNYQKLIIFTLKTDQSTKLKKKKKNQLNFKSSKTKMGNLPYLRLLQEGERGR